MRSIVVVLLLAVTAVAHGLSEPIDIEILEPPDRGFIVTQWPVSVGVVLTEGELADPSDVHLVTADGRHVPCDIAVTGWWDAAHTSIKWLLLEFTADADQAYRLVGGAAPADTSAVMVSQQNGNITVDTGPLRVEWHAGSGKLFDAVTADGTALGSATQVMEITYAERITSVREWEVAVEQSTSRRAVIHATGYFAISWQPRLAKIDVRYHFFKGERVVRVEHTFTWMVENPCIGIREYAIKFDAPAPGGDKARFAVGGAGEWEWSKGDHITAWQHEAAQFIATRGADTLGEGEYLTGWAQVQRGDVAIGVAIRDAWQMYPTAFELTVDGTLIAAMLPRSGPPAGFMYEDLMPPRLFNSPEWSRYRPTDVAHMTNEWQGNPYFKHTAEGAARTSELTFHFSTPKAARTIAEVNALTQDPVVARQDPASACRVPIMGMKIEPVDAERYPVMEAALDRLGRMCTARWPDTHDYGFWRFGMQRWGTVPYEGAQAGLYRWFDGVQYDQQMLPWLLFTRGGDRQFAIEGHRVCRYAADVYTNHYNTRGVEPGYQAGASAYPFPWINRHLHKHIKIHFLQMQHHLTGDRRAGDVMRTVIDGALWAAAHDERTPDHAAYRGWGRELYNVAWLWAGIWQETFDPLARWYGKEYRDLMLSREYNADLHVFRAPPIYQFNAIAAQHEVWPEPPMQQVLLDHMTAQGYPDMPQGAVHSTEPLITCDLAQQLTGDKRYGQIAFDLARLRADRMPTFDPDQPMSQYFEPVRGNDFARGLILPILAGLSSGMRAGLLNDHPTPFTDGHMALDMNTPQDADRRGQAFVRARRDGDMTFHVSILDIWDEDLLAPMQVEVGGATYDIDIAEPKIENRFYPIDLRTATRTITINNAKAGDVYPVIIIGGKSTHTAGIRGDVDIAYHVPRAQYTGFRSFAGGEAVLYVKTNGDGLTITDSHRHRFAIRDAKTWELLYQTPLEAPKQIALDLGKDRLIAIIGRGHRFFIRFDGGVEPYFSPTADSWFAPPSP